jgi:hypothetical protein
MKTTHELTLHFLGQRTYLQGPTLFEALITKYRHPTKIFFKVSRPLLTNRVLVVPAVQANRDNIAAILNLNDPKEGQLCLAIEPLPRSGIVKRRPFDETQVVDIADFTGESASLMRPSPFGLATTVTSLNKALLLRLLQPPTSGQWLFARLDLAGYPTRFQSLIVRYRSRVAFAAVLSDIVLDEVLLGRITFSWGNIA